MLRDIFTFLKRLILSFVLFVFVAILGIFSSAFLCDFLKDYRNALCIHNGDNAVVLGVLLYGTIIATLLLILSKKNRISIAWLFYFFSWLILGCFFLKLYISSWMI